MILKSKLKKNMSQEEANITLAILGYTVAIADPQYLGDEFLHNWYCKCGNLMLKKKFKGFRKNKNKRCDSCIFLEKEEMYKSIVNNETGYFYIKSYRSGDTIIKDDRIILVKDSPYIEIFHSHCGKTNTVTYGGFKSGKRCTCAKYQNSVQALYPEISKLIYKDNHGNLIDEKTKKSIHAHSGKKFYFKCSTCDSISSKTLTLAAITAKDYSCNICSDGISIPEKFLINLFVELNIQYIFQKSFSWSERKVYDFYLPSINLIIETHGIQHYEESARSMRTLIEEQLNDQKKLELAKKHNMNFLTIDCRESNLEWLKTNCIKKLPSYLDLKNINWTKIWSNSQLSYTKKTWDLWNEEKSVKEISKLLNLADTTIRKYLTVGKETKNCTYNGQLEKNKIKRSVICITTNQIFESISSAAAKYELTLKALHRCCNSKYKKLGTTKSGELLTWMYYDEYLKTIPNEIHALLEIKYTQ